MIAILSLLAGAAFFGLMFTYVLWTKITFKWLQYLTVGLVASLPFERIPSLDIGPATVRPSQIIFLLCVYLIIILLIKKDSDLKKVKLRPLSIFLLVFVAFTIPSWFFITDINRFWTTSIATWLSFGIAAVISQFLFHRIAAFYGLLISLFVSSIFAVYQFLGDMLGLPIVLTGLREQYTKIVFGFPRVHSTALEPLYYAGMLFIPIITFTLLILADRSIIKKYPSWVINIISLYGFSLVFLLAFSKGAIVILAFVVGLLVIFWSFRNRSIKIAVRVASVVTLPLIILYGYFVINPETPEFVTSIAFHLQETIDGKSATVLERSQFVDSAAQLLPEYIISGSGSGQYGVIAAPLLKNLTQSDPNGYLIVNNVYLEIWLEFGFFALIWFLFIFAYYIFKGFTTVLKIKDWRKIEVIILITLIFSLFGYMLQWLTFSPIYIVPIFILIGFLDSMLQSSYIIKHVADFSQTAKTTTTDDNMVNNLYTN